MKSLSAIESELRRSPFDEHAWLVYGDHLMEQGDPRGQLISLEHARAASDGRERRGIDLAINKLSREYEPLAKRAAPRAGTALHHGFITGLELTWGPNTHDELARFLTHPESRFLSTVAVTDAVDAEGRSGSVSAADDAIGELLSLDLRRLVTLSFAYLAASDAGVRKLRSLLKESLPDLRHLDLRYVKLGDEAVGALATTPVMRDLSALSLQSCGIGPLGAEHLARFECPHLDLLDLRDNPVGERGAVALAQNLSLTKLTTLRVHQRDVGEAGLLALSESRSLPRTIRSYLRARHAAGRRSQ